MLVKTKSGDGKTHSGCLVPRHEQQLSALSFLVALKLQQEGILRAQSSGPRAAVGDAILLQRQGLSVGVWEQIEPWKSEALSDRETSTKGRSAVQEGDDRAFPVST